MYLFDPPLDPPWTRGTREHEEDEEQERHRGELGDRADGRDERLVPAARKEGQPLHKNREDKHQNWEDTPHFVCLFLNVAHSFLPYLKK